MPTSTYLNALAAAGLAPNTTGPGFVAYNYNPAPAGKADTSGTSLTTFGPGQPAANLAADTSYSNLQAIPNIDSLTQLVNQINSRAQQQLNADRLGPQGQAVQNTLLSNAAAGAQGQLTPSELRILQMGSAERGAGGGFGVDSPNISSDFMDRYLRTSYDRQQDALKNYSTLLADNPSAPLYGAQNNLVTPGVYANTAAQQADLQYKYAALQAAINAANQNRYRGGAGTTPTTTTTQPAPSTFPTFTPTPVPTSTAPTATPVTPFGYEDTFGGASAAASGGDQTYQDWAYWYDPFGFGDWSQGYGNQVPADTYYDPSTDTSNYDYGLGDYYYGG